MWPSTSGRCSPSTVVISHMFNVHYRPATVYLGMFLPALGIAITLVLQARPELHATELRSS